MHRSGVRSVAAALLLGLLAGCGGTATPAQDTATASSPTSTSRVSTSAVTAPPLTPSEETRTEPLQPATSSSPEPPPTATTEPSTVAPPPETEVPPLPPEPATNGAVAGLVVVIDPGHNGGNGAHPDVINAPVDAGFGETKPCNTTGTSTNGGYAEHEFTWAVANHVRDILESQGVVVVMTRDSDDGVGPCVNERAAIGNQNDAAAVVSIHGDGSAEGDRGFYAMTAQRQPAGDDMASLSADLAAAVRDQLVAAGLVPSNYVGSEGLWKRDDLAGLNLSFRPTTMIELGNMRDSQDSVFMTSEDGQYQMAQGIAAGIIAYLEAH